MVGTCEVPMQPMICAIGMSCPIGGWLSVVSGFTGGFVCVNSQKRVHTGGVSSGLLSSAVAVGEIVCIHVFTPR